mmetsp:Transcript_126228/g.404031  ORF Transcript_126228/g.404031 Transcript_126228/m.404031 type:complete len:634 (+) Transcript_126228:84-1985(+)
MVLELLACHLERVSRPTLGAGLGSHQPQVARLPGAEGRARRLPGVEREAAVAAGVAVACAARCAAPLAGQRRTRGRRKQKVTLQAAVARGVHDGFAGRAALARRPRDVAAAVAAAAVAAKAQAVAPEGCEDADNLLTSEPSAVELLLRALTFNSRAALLLSSYLPVFIKSKLADSRGEEVREGSEIEKEWQEVHSEGAVDLESVIDQLKGFYVKCGQVIATRSDLFPREYSSQLSHMVDSVNPLPFSVIRGVVEEDLLGGLPLEDAFESFDQNPLGSASIAQVHRATLKGGREVAVKVQRPFVEPRLMSDVRVIKNFCYLTRKLFPLDYYVVFSELEEQLQEEFDFVAEADAMDRMGAALQRGGRRPPVLIPRSVPGLCSKRVLCMDFVPGVPLSRVRDELQRRGLAIEEGSRAEKLFGRGLLSALTEAFGVMIFEEGFFHADPHPGNVFVLPDSSVALIDFGQTKRIGYKFRRQLAELVVEICDNDGKAEEDLPFEKFASLAEKQGVKFLPDAKKECAAALALWLIDTSRTTLPGGYVSNELSPDCPVRDVASFPRDFVLVCRTTLLIRGLAMRLGVEWSLAKAWRGYAERLLGDNAIEPARVAAAPLVAFGVWTRPLAWLWNLTRRMKGKR